ncbi:MAG TPA: DJ-1/PfpI family protein [Chloroflexia bacterium]|nr:DJ-1/PfpI family protein [Chloroflexia bacterium]
MKIAIVTFDGFNEIDSFVALNILNRVKQAGWKAELVAPSATVTSLNGVTVQVEKGLDFANVADVVLFGSGRKTREVIKDEGLMASFKLDPQRQLIGSQCSGALIMQRLGLLQSLPACTDSTTRPYLEETGITVLGQPFYAEGNIATAGGCLSSQYLAAWVLLQKLGEAAMADALRYVAPVGEEEKLISHTLEVITGYQRLIPERLIQASAL